ncbi:MAG: helicase-related protein [Hyphomonadaceae bacterium]
MSAASRLEAPLKAVLGPTNTGKTHLAIERMLAHRSGMIGLPLRLLAREVYDKAVAAKGAGAVALITGEEKIAPESARYFVATVEAMPLDRAVEFLAVDEIQLARDPDRGHIFTDRLMRARGVVETMLLGADTMRRMIRQHAPKAEISYRERLSRLSYVGPRKITKLPKRSAVVAFSAEEVYAIAELLRRHRGGAAVVMGALSPRTRNAQVALYQNGEVDFLVATDAIGMGLNMDVDHVAFASATKFDGRRTRPLRADEIAQIAGRAGRFRNDGTFGETGECAPFDEEIVERVEAHAFETVEALEWRNHRLDFSSVPRLIAALEQKPGRPGLVRTRGAIDEATLKTLADDHDLMAHARHAGAVARLWEICQIPDFRKASVDEHARLVARFAAHLLKPKGRLPAEMIAREIAALDRSEGDLSALQARLAHIRTWTYAANRADWLADAAEWRARTREIEDRVSDALHAALAQRFIDRRTSALLKGLRREDALLAGVSETGEVTVEGHYVGRLEGLTFVADPRALGLEGRAVRNAAQRALAPEVSRRLARIAAAEASAFSLERDGRVRFENAPVARLIESPMLAPRLALIGAEGAFDSARRAALARLEAWLNDAVKRELAPLAALSAAWRAGALPAAARGLAFRLIENAGAVDRAAVEDLVRQASPDARAALAALGFRIGRHTLYAPALLRPRAAALGAILQHWTEPAPGPAPLALRRGAQSLLLARTGAPGRPWAAYAAAGLRPAGPAAVRIERLERTAAALHAGVRPGKGAPTPEKLARLLGVKSAALAEVLTALGYRRVAGGEEAGAPPRWRPPAPAKRRGPRPAAAADGPFADLAALLPAAPRTRK